MTEQALFSLDLNLCTGCGACSIACSTENDLDENPDWRHIYTFNESRVPEAAVFHYSLACNHCSEPACAAGCPANAYTKSDRTGVVRLDPNRCIGCRYCAWVCPYDAPQFNPRSGVMEKCTFCEHRLESGGAPACVASCPTGALGFVPRGEPRPVHHPGIPETGLGPGLAVTSKRGHAAAPVMSADARKGVACDTVRCLGNGIRTEWTLLVFSYLLTVLVAWFTASRSGGIPFHLPVFLGTGAVAIGVSLLHLGRPARAWRAVVNLRRSWVSREIFFSTAFLVAVPIVVRLLPGRPSCDALVVALGFAALGSMDMVYRVRGHAAPLFPHSAMTVVTAAMLIGLAWQDPWLAGPAWVIKLTLFLSRIAAHRDLPWPMPTIRVLAGFVWPIAARMVFASPDPALIVAGPLVGEAIDRALFYAELRFPSPGLQVELDLRRLVDLRRAGRGMPLIGRVAIGDGAQYPP